ncbi:MAG TPA: Gfo/Idh/MocA family oxidoreductase [Acidimicrobiales bacterium]|jgi:predicted dehydrogenase
MERVRLGVVGVGNIAPLNVAGYLEHERCDVVAVCDPRAELAERRAREWQVPRVYTRLEDLLGDDDIDAVEILSPTHLHKDHVVAAANAGKHVSCQKPMANSVAEARVMLAAADEAGIVFRVSECFYHYPPLVEAKRLIGDGAVGTPTMLRIRTVVGDTDSPFQAALDPAGYEWRFDSRSPGGHLFDDVVHKYAVALWLFPERIRSVQAVVRPGALFFEAPTAAIFEYERDDLLGTMEVTHAPQMRLRTRYYGADEVFEVQGTDGFVWVTRATGEMLDLSPLLWHRSDGTMVGFSNLDADWGTGFRLASRAFVDALLEGTRPEMSGQRAIEVLQLCFAVYQASATRSPIEPVSIEGAASPPWWPKSARELLADADRLGLVPEGVDVDTLVEQLGLE